MFERNKSLQSTAREEHAFKLRKIVKKWDNVALAFYGNDSSHYLDVTNKLNEITTDFKLTKENLGTEHEGQLIRFSNLNISRHPERNEPITVSDNFEAFYGHTKYKRVTDIIRSKHLTIRPHNGELGGDPDPGKPKQLVVAYV